MATGHLPPLFFARIAVLSCLVVPCLQASYALTLELSEEERNFDDKIDILETNGLQQVQLSGVCGVAVEQRCG